MGIIRAVRVIGIRGIAIINSKDRGYKGAVIVRVKRGLESESELESELEFNSFPFFPSSSIPFPIGLKPR